MSNHRGILFVFSGPSGVGKDTVLECFLAHSKNTVQSVSATTRLMREGETDGKDYFFLTKERFEGMIAAGEMLEFAQYGGNYYGTPRSFVEKTLESGKNVLLKIEVQGALQVRAAFPEAVLIFIMPPSFQELKRRLVGRGTDSEESICCRLKAAVDEISKARQYDYIIVNDEVQRACEHLRSIIGAAEHQSKFYQKFMEEVHRDAKTCYDTDD